jgi:predicted MFS family arabinose efflux permease
VSVTDRPSTFAAFRVRSFRFQWPADLLASWAVEMEVLILGWYVMVQSGSVLLLTLFGSLQFLGTLAAPVFGVLGDRLGNRSMLFAMRATYVALAGLLMFLAAAGALSPAAVLAIAAVGGVLRPNDLVMRNSLIGDTIPRAHLMGALALSRTTQDSARVAGALAGASLSAALGIAFAYVFVCLFYLASLALTFGVSRGRPVPDPSGGAPARARSAGASGAEAPSPSLPRPSGWRDLSDGMVYVWTTPKVLAAMCLAFLVNLTAYPLSHGLLPYVAREVYRIDATGLGWLAGSFALGALLGSVAMAVTGRPRRAEPAMIVAVALWYAMLLVFGQARTVGAGAAILLVAGFVQSLGMVSMAGSLLHAAGDRFRARVMGVRTLAVYGLPLGLLAAGALIDRVGFTATVVAYCAVGLVFTALIASWWRASLWPR